MNKQNDLILGSLVNDGFGIKDFQAVGYTPDNTGIQDKEYYYNNKIVQQIFTNKDGSFNQESFDEYYDATQATYNLWCKDQENDQFQRSFKYSKYNALVPESLREPEEKHLIIKSDNIDRIQKNLIHVGRNENPEFSMEEIAQTQKVWDSANNVWLDSPNDNFFGNFWDTLVIATYDKDGFYKDHSGKVNFHKAGEYKLNDQGTYYYETLNGRSSYGKIVLNKFNTLTVDGSWANKYLDIFDSDSIEAPGLGKTILKNTALIGSMFLPYVGEVIAGISAGVQIAGLVSVAGKMVLGSDSPMLNNIEGWVHSVNRQTLKHSSAVSDPWKFTNIIDITADFMGQLKEQRWLFEWVPMLWQGSKLKTYTWGRSQEVANKAFEAKKNALLKKLTDEKTNMWTTSIKSKLANVENKNYAEAIKTFHDKAASEAAFEVQTLIKQHHKIGEIASKVYMAGLISSNLYADMKAQGVQDRDAAWFTLGRFASELALLYTPFGNYILPELRLEKLGERAIAPKLIEETNKTLFKRIASESAAVNLTTPGEKISWLKKLMQYGASTRNAVENAVAERKMKSAIMGGFASGVEAGIVNDLEEFLNDTWKQLYNTKQWIVDDKHRVTAWNDMFNRYGVGMVSGVVGGGLTSAGTNMIMYDPNSVPTNFNQAWQHLISMMRNGQTESFLSTLNNTELASKNLSATKYSLNEKGERIYDAAIDYEDSQDYYLKQLIRNQVQNVQRILDSTGCSISDSSFLDGYLQDARWNQLQKTASAHKLLTYHNTLCTELVATEMQIKSMENKQGDSDRAKAKEAKTEDEVAEASINALKKKRDTILKELDEIHSGKYATKYMREAYMEMSQRLIHDFIPVNLDTYIQAMTGHAKEDLNTEQVEELTESYKNYLQTGKADDIQGYADFIFNLTKNLGNKFGEHINEYKAAFDKPILDNIAILTKTKQVVDQLTLGFSTEEAGEQWQQKLQDLVSNWAMMVQDGIFDTNSEQYISMQKLIEQYQADAAVFQTLNTQISQAEKEVGALKKQTEKARAKVAELEQKLVEDPTNESLKNDKLKADNELNECQTNEQNAVNNLKALQNQSSLSAASLAEQINNIRENTQSNLFAKLTDVVNEYAKRGWMPYPIKQALSSALDLNTQMATKLDTLISSAQIAEIIPLINQDAPVSKQLDAIKQLSNTDLTEGIVSQIDLLSPEFFAEMKDSGAYFDKFNVDDEVRNDILYAQALLKSTKTTPSLLKQQIAELPESPILNLISDLRLVVSENKTSTVKDTLDRLEALFSNSARNLNQFDLTSIDAEEDINMLKNTIKVLKTMLEAAKTDTLSSDNLLGYNHIQNEVARQVGEEGWVDLLEIDTDTANTLLVDLQRIENRVNLFDKLNTINQNQKLARQDRVGILKDVAITKLCHEFAKSVKDIEGGSDLLQAVESAQTLLNLKTDPLVYTPEQEEKMFSEFCAIQDAVYTFVQKHINNQEMLEKIFNPTRFNMHEPANAGFTEKQTRISSQQFFGWIVAHSAIKASSFYSTYKEILSEDPKNVVAPLPIQENATFSQVARALNQDVGTKCAQAFRDSYFKWFSSLTVTDRLIELNKYKGLSSTDKKLASEHPEFLYTAVPTILYELIVFTEGNAGTGKTAAVLPMSLKVIQALDPNHKILSNVALCFATDNKKAAEELVEKKLKDTGAKVTVFTKKELLEALSSEYKPPVKTGKMYKEDTSKLTFTHDGELKLNRKTNASAANKFSLIVIDEITNLTRADAELVNDYCREAGICTWGYGDFHQTSNNSYLDFSKTELAKYVSAANNNLKHGLNYYYMLQSIPLGLSMRTTSKQKDLNNYLMQDATDVVINNRDEIELRTQLHYYLDDKTFAGDYVYNPKGIEDFAKTMEQRSPCTQTEYFQLLYGSSLEDSKSQLRKIIDTMFKTLNTEKGEKVGFIGWTKESPLYKYLEKTYNGKFVEFIGESAQGLEAKYYIGEILPPNLKIDEDGKVAVKTELANLRNIAEYAQDVNTAQSRAQEGSILIAPWKNFVADSIPDGSTASQAYSQEGLLRFTIKRKKLYGSIENAETLTYIEPNTVKTEAPEQPTNNPTSTPVDVATIIDSIEIDSSMTAQGIFDKYSNELTQITQMSESPRALLDALLKIKNIDRKTAIELGLIAAPNNQAWGGAVGFLYSVVLSNTLQLGENVHGESKTNVSGKEKLSEPLMLPAISEINNLPEIEAIEVDYDKETDEGTVTIIQSDGKSESFSVDKSIIELAKKEGFLPLYQKPVDILPIEEEECTDEEIAKEIIVQAQEDDNPIEVTPQISLSKDLEGFYLYGFNTYTLGMTDDILQNLSQIDQSEKLKKRIDSAFGIRSIFASNGKNLSKDELIEKCKAIIPQLRNACFFKNKADILSAVKIAFKLQGVKLNDKLQCEFFLKSSPISEKRTTNEQFDALGAELLDDVSEKTLNNGTQKELMRTISIRIAQDGTDILELPLLTLGNPLSLIKSKGYEAVAKVYDEFRNSAEMQGKNLAQVNFKFGQKLVAEGNSGLGYLFQLYGQTSRYLIPLKNWTIAENLKHVAPTMVTKEKKGLEDDTYKYVPEYMSVEELKKKSGFTTSPVYQATGEALYVNKTPISGRNGKTQIFKPGIPFVLYTKETGYYAKDLLDEYLEQLQDPSKPQTIGLAYVVPPAVSVKEYIEQLHDHLLNKDSVVFGGQFMGFNIMSKVVDPSAQKYFIDNALKYGTVPEVMEGVFKDIQDIADKMTNAASAKEKNDIMFESLAKTGYKNLQNFLGNSDTKVAHALTKVLHNLCYQFEDVVINQLDSSKGSNTIKSDKAIDIIADCADSIKKIYYWTKVPKGNQSKEVLGNKFLLISEDYSIPKLKNATYQIFGKPETMQFSIDSFNEFAQLAGLDFSGKDFGPELNEYGMAKANKSVYGAYMDNHFVRRVSAGNVTPHASLPKNIIPILEKHNIPIDRIDSEKMKLLNGTEEEFNPYIWDANTSRLYVISEDSLSKSKLPDLVGDWSALNFKQEILKSLQDGSSDFRVGGKYEVSIKPDGEIIISTSLERQASNATTSGYICPQSMTKVYPKESIITLGNQMWSPSFTSYQEFKAGESISFVQMLKDMCIDGWSNSDIQTYLDAIDVTEVPADFQEIMEEFKNWAKANKEQLSKILSDAYKEDSNVSCETFPILPINFK